MNNANNSRKEKKKTSTTIVVNKVLTYVLHRVPHVVYFISDS